MPLYNPSAGGNTGSISAGTTRGTLGEVVLSNSNGLSFGMNGQTVTGSYTVPSTAGLLSNFRVSAGTTSNLLSAVTFANGNGITFGLDASTVTASHNGLTSQSNQAVSAANGAFDFQTLSFSNANGVSFGTSAGSAITASHNGLTSQSGQAFSAQGGSSAFQTLSFSNANGISFSNNAGQVQASYTVPTVTNSSMSVSDAATSGTLARLAFTNLNGVTLSLSTGGGGSHTIVGSHNALTSQSNQNVTAGNGGFAFQTLSFSNVNGISFGTSAGSAITASHNALTTARASNDAVGLNNAQTNVTWTVSSNGISLNAAGYAGTGTSATNASITLDLEGLAISVAAPGVTRMTAYAVSNTTQSSTGTIPISSLQFAGAGIASVGITNGSVVVSVPAGGGGGDGGAFVGVSTGGNTAGSTGVVSTGNAVFVGMNDITLSQSTGAAGSNATVSIIAPPPISGWVPYQNAVQVLAADSNQSLLLAPHSLAKAVQFDRVVFPIYFSQATNSTLTVSRSVFWGLYTKNGSSLSLYDSGSGSYSINGSGTASSGQNSGIRIVSFGNTTTISQGNYWFGVVYRSSTAGANATLSIMVRSDINSTVSGYIGSASVTNQAFHPGLGVWTSTTSGMPNSVAFSDIRANSSAFQRSPIVLFTSGSH